ncbi:MAG: mechanosensitive ion channel domain-containing protein [Anaerolineales bacterium]
MDTELLTSTLRRMSEQISDNLPAIIMNLLLILIGWGVARLLTWLVKRFIIRIGLNEAFERTVIAQELKKIKSDQTLADITSKLTFWLVWLYIIFIVLSASDLNVGLTPIAGIVSYLPRLFIAFLILVIGVLVAQFIGHWVQVSVAATGAEYHQALGKGTRLLIIVLVVITAIEAIGVNLTPVTNAITNIITILIAGIALAFGVGARNIVGNILAGYYARENFKVGDQINIDGEIGTLEAIGVVNSEMNTPDSYIIFPNSNLTDKAVKKIKSE